MKRLYDAEINDTVIYTATLTTGKVTHISSPSEGLLGTKKNITIGWDVGGSIGTQSVCMYKDPNIQPDNSWENVIVAESEKELLLLKLKYADNL
jgi:hypothetical protein